MIVGRLLSNPVVMRLSIKATFTVGPKTTLIVSTVLVHVVRVILSVVRLAKVMTAVLLLLLLLLLLLTSVGLRDALACGLLSLCGRRVGRRVSAVLVL